MPHTRTMSFALLACVSLLSLPCAAGDPAQLVINEVMTNPLPGTNPESGFWDTFDGVTRFVDSDWVELYNPGPGEVPLEGLRLSDNCNHIRKYEVSAEAAAILAPDGLLPEGGFAVIWCPGWFRGDYDCTTEPDGECDYPIPVEMAPITLSPLGEWIGLYTSAGVLIDGFQIPQLPAGRTYGSVPDGNKSGRAYLQAPSPKKANESVAAMAPLITARSYRAVKALGDPPVETYSLRVDGGDAVRIRANVIDFDDPDATDSDGNIEEVSVWWKLTTPGSPAGTLAMTQVASVDPLEDDPSLYEARIPGQENGKVVAFHIYARDKQGNESRSYWSDAYNPDADPKIWFQYPVGNVGFSNVTILINEVLADNQETSLGGGDPAIAAEVGGYDCGVEGCIDGRREADEWVELYNFGDTGVDLASCDLFLTNDGLYPTRFPLEHAVGHHPNVAAGVLGTGMPMLVWCDGQPWQNDTVGVHADFTLRPEEGDVLLVAYRDADADGDPELFVVTDCVSWGVAESAGGPPWLGAQDGDWSLGRFPDGAAQWGRMDPTCGASPRPGAPNTGFAPAVKVLGHEPVMATPSDVVKVTARVWDDMPLPALPAPDPAAEGWCGVKIDFGDFVSLGTTKVMRDDGLEGDAVAGDGIYTAMLTDESGNRPVGKVRYAVTAVDNNGNKVRVPRYPTVYVMFFVGEQPASAPVITEVVASNRNCQCDAALPPGCDRAGLDNFGDAEGWVEIYNPAEEPIYLGDYSLTNRFDWLTRWIFPAVMLGAGERIVVWCDNELDQTDSWPVPSVHACFQLDAGGDEVYLAAKAMTDRQIVDFVTFGEQLPDVSSGRPEGGGDFGVLLEATPGEPNAPLAANVESIAQEQPVAPGSTITVRGLALDRAVKVFLVDPLVMEGDEVDKWNWQEAAEMPFQRVDADLRAALPPQLANGPHRLCVLSEYDPVLHARGAWTEGGIAWTSLLLESSDAAGRFVRGDVNADGKRDIADPIALLAHLFKSAAAPSCPDAADGNDDGKLDIADAIRVLGYLFGSAGDLPPPSPSCGHDQTADILGLCRHPPCE